ncbi:hypothetical protein ACFWAY_44465 [Rhodococcus sp. NPDC059968]|uniref:hypothetical protein n=1 Tax=Rhodococcus sp. NPDC059968 TaxID=3347017 RepID=UPI0036707415
MSSNEQSWRQRGHHTECEALDRLVATAGASQSHALVWRGEAGIGKTAVSEYLLDHAPGCRTPRAVGVDSEMEPVFAGLQQHCAPMLDHLDPLPCPQRHALAIAFGLRTGDPPDRRIEREVSSAAMLVEKTKPWTLNAFSSDRSVISKRDTLHPHPHRHSADAGAGRPRRGRRSAGSKITRSVHGSTSDGPAGPIDLLESIRVANRSADPAWLRIFQRGNEVTDG